MENTVVLSFTDQSEGTIEIPTQKKYFGLWTFKTLCIHTEYSSSFWCQGNHNYSCKLKFKEQSIIGQNPHQVHGLVQDRNGKTIAILFGKWDESMHYVDGNCSGKGKRLDLDVTDNEIQTMPWAAILEKVVQLQSSQ
ncbi:hypothetical protein FEM48_Zijuj01G0219400 [Ziziphus jujuba var. spinosa]|uniref:Uncharacterized protein n=1 Tax=Ziziphus jujuba var. spinosa TaxID=714518 RepID=A0A978W3S6_ZIZJJ|nr:hypothetical protein FEM48_Zijuj01G0219400 [Ziziphus jujuba var. spinosa]